MVKLHVSNPHFKRAAEVETLSNHKFTVEVAELPTLTEILLKVLAVMVAEAQGLV